MLELPRALRQAVALEALEWCNSGIETETFFDVDTFHIWTRPASDDVDEGDSVVLAWKSDGHQNEEYLGSLAPKSSNCSTMMEFLIDRKLGFISWF